jgi:phasin family protein
MDKLTGGYTMATQELQQTADKARETFLAPTRELTSLNIELFEQVTDLQINTLKQMTDLGLSRARSALDIRDVDSLQQYLREQGEAASTLGRQIQDDTQKLIGLGQDYARKAGEVAQKPIQSATRSAKSGSSADS